MKTAVVPIASLGDLMTALPEREPRALELQTSVACPYSIALPPGYSLSGKHKDSGNRLIRLAVPDRHPAHAL
jgi:hypothetical protein